MRMYFEGHAGFSLLILSLFILVFGWVDGTSIMICLAIVVFSSLPDIDLSWHPFVKHRGPTHTLLFGVIFGTVLGSMFHYTGQGWFFGFTIGFMSTLLHLLGDVFTYEPIKPLEPFSHREIAMRLFRSSNLVANKGFMALGVLAFLTIILKYGSYL